MAATTRIWSLPRFGWLQPLHILRVALFSSKSTVFTPRTWSDEDLKLARGLKAKDTPLQEWRPLFPGRTYRSLSELKNRNLNHENQYSSRKKWTAAELEVLCALKARNAEPEDFFQALPGRSMSAISTQWRLHGPRDQSGELLHSNRNLFTLEEYQFVKDCRARGMTFDKIQAEHFPQRTAAAISKLSVNGAYNRANRRPWTEAEVTQLQKLREAQKLSYQEIASIMNRSHVSVARRSFDMLQGRSAMFKHCRKWSDEEVARLQSMRQAGIGLSEIASALNRSVRSVSAKHFRCREAGT